MLRPGVADDTIDETVAKLEAEFKAEVQQVGARYVFAVSDPFPTYPVPTYPVPAYPFPLKTVPAD